MVAARTVPATIINAECFETLDGKIMPVSIPLAPAELVEARSARTTACRCMISEDGAGNRILDLAVARNEEMLASNELIVERFMLFDEDSAKILDALTEDGGDLAIRCLPCDPEDDALVLVMASDKTMAFVLRRGVAINAIMTLRSAYAPCEPAESDKAERRTLLPYSQRYLKVLLRGGEQRVSCPPGVSADSHEGSCSDDQECGGSYFA